MRRAPISQQQVDQIWRLKEAGVADLWQIAGIARCSRESVKEIIATGRRWAYDASGPEFMAAMRRGLDLVDAGASVRAASLEAKVRYNELAHAVRKRAGAGMLQGRPAHVVGDEYSDGWYASCNDAYVAAMQEHYPGQTWTDVVFKSRRTAERVVS